MEKGKNKIEEDFEWQGRMRSTSSRSDEQSSSHGATSGFGHGHEEANRDGERQGMAMMEEFDNSDATGFRDGLERTGGVVVPLRYQHQLHADQGGSHTAGYMMRGIDLPVSNLQSLGYETFRNQHLIAGGRALPPGMWTQQQMPAAFGSALSAQLRTYKPLGPFLPATVNAQQGVAPSSWFVTSNNATGLVTTSSSHGGSVSVIRDIWADTAQEAFCDIGSLLKGDPSSKFMVGIDSEFAIPDGAKTEDKEPPSADAHYSQLCRMVNGGDLVQIGIAVANDRFEILGIWQFNLQFDPSWRLPGHKGVAFLRGAAFKLEEHAERGIAVADFIRWLWGSGAISNSSLTWVTFMGYPDFGFLVKLLMGQEALPESRLMFLRQFWQLFPLSYDLRVFTKLGRGRKEIIHGGLAKVCEKLQVTPVGEAHHAGSDALTALLCLQKLMTSDSEFAQNMTRFCAVLYGVDQ